ncbi:hypothetical protein H4R20_006326, partial [Coemansia guatemalensis]
MLSVTLSTALLGTVLAAAQDAIGDVVSGSVAMKADGFNDGMWVPDSGLLSGIDNGLWSTDSEFLNPSSTTFTGDSSTAESTDSTEDTAASEDSTTSNDISTDDDDPSSESEDMKQNRFLQIYCPEKDCSKERDWLTKLPNAATGWTLGAISLIISLITFRFSRGSEEFKFFLPPSGTG